MFRFDNTYGLLPERFYARVSPTRVRDPRIVKVNRALADALGIDGAALESSQGAEVLAGNVIPEGAEPIALAYAGHQFGFVRQLGDGRAVLLGEVVGKDGARRDIQLKGAGRTPPSRGAATAAPRSSLILREYVVSEAMAALGIPTTRALAAVTTGEALERDGRVPGAVFARVAASHIRVGTFEFFAARDDKDALAASPRTPWPPPADAAGSWAPAAPSRCSSRA